MTARTCGECFACCKWLGIDELKKWPGKTCRHINNTGDSTKLCSIYENRPVACSTYKCVWLETEDYISDSLRPDLSGILMTGYKGQDSDASLSVTAMVFDRSKAGTMSVGPLSEIIKTLLNANLRDLRIVYPETKQVIHFFEGQIHKGDLLPSHNYEELNFQTYNPPLGTWELK